MNLARLGSSWGTIPLVLLSTLSIYVSVLLYTRISGLRSLATMSSFDFAATVGIGSIVASVATASTSAVSGAVAMAALYVLQASIAVARRSEAARIVDNQPLLLMAGDEILDANLRQARLTELELMAQLRQQGVTRLSEVRAVIFESAGTISVLTGDHRVEARLLDGVRGRDRLTDA